MTAQPRGGAELRRRHDLEKELGRRFGGGLVDPAVDRDDAAEGGDRIGVERRPNCIDDARMLGDAAGHRVLDDLGPEPALRLYGS